MTIQRCGIFEEIILSEQDFDNIKTIPNSDAAQKTVLQRDKAKEIVDRILGEGENSGGSMIIKHSLSNLLIKKGSDSK